MPKGFSEYEKKLISERLLDQGYKQFTAYGLKKTNVEELARAAGISKGAFYLFYESKEALFMDVIEQTEVRFRKEVLDMIDLPGSTPRARLFAVLKKAFSLVKDIPLLRFLTGSDYDLLFRRVPAEKFQEHLANDRKFFEELIVHCHDSGIDIKANPENIIQLLYPIVLAILHNDDFGANNFGNVDLLLELVSAYCLGEVELEYQNGSDV